MNNLFLFAQINYKADHTQLTYLQLMSTKAVQQVTFHCRNTIGYFDPQANNYRRGIKLLAYNDAEILPRANNRLRYKAIVDDCQVSAILFNHHQLTVVQCQTGLSQYQIRQSGATKPVARHSVMIW